MKGSGSGSQSPPPSYGTYVPPPPQEGVYVNTDFSLTCAVSF
jgi:hypothetical protein